MLNIYHKWLINSGIMIFLFHHIIRLHTNLKNIQL